MAHTSLASLFSDIADAIRAKTGGTAALVADDFPTAIAGIPAGLTLASPLTAKRSSATAIAFSSLQGKPEFFAVVVAGGSIQLTSSGYRTLAVIYDGTDVRGVYFYRGSSSAIGYNSTTDFSYTWNAGTSTLTVSTSNSSYVFHNNYNYQLIYAY